MEKIIEDLRAVIQEFSKKITAMPDAELYAKPFPNKWSKIEVVGHLIDSAQNNLRRFICGQYEATPPRIVYDQDFWVTANRYSQAPKTDVIQLWVLLNERIAGILKTMPATNYSKECNTGQASEHRTLEWLATDYVKHLKHHLNQILPASFDVVYP
jgi:hypothetical protein